MTMATEPASRGYSSLRTAPRVDLAGRVPLAAPLAIYVEPTNICNFRCTYCPESEPGYQAISGGWFQLDETRFARILDDIDSLPVRPATLNFYMMGEPFVNKSLPSMVALAKRRNVAGKVIVTSNGSLLTEDVSQRIVASGLDFLRVSIYGASEETHRARTGSPIRLARIVDNLETFRRVRGDRERPFLYVKMIDTQDAAENAAFVERFGPLADEATIEPVMNWNDVDAKNRTNVERSAMLASGYFASKKEVCPFPFYTLVIHSDLRVSACCVDWSKQAVVGDLNHESLADVWAGPRLRAFQDLHLQRRRHEIAACRNCTYLHTAPDRMDDLGWDAWAERTGRSGPTAEASAVRATIPIAVGRPRPTPSVD